jgi:uncharacterized membrane protein
MLETFSAVGETHPAIEQTLEQAVAIIRPGFHMGIDSALALFPFLLALVLFRSSPRLPGPVWWPLLGVFILFLPNAPYILTDVIHFVAKVRVTPPLPIWAMSLLLLEYFFYFLFGMQCFTLSMMLWGKYLKGRRPGWMVFPLEIVIIALSSFAIYLGRIDRLNSWNLVTDPGALMSDTLRDAMAPKPEQLTAIFFASVTVIHYLLKGANHAVALLLRHRGGEKS